MTHYVAYFIRPIARWQGAFFQAAPHVEPTVCGDIVRAGAGTPEPTCPACQIWLAQTADSHGSRPQDSQDR